MDRLLRETEAFYRKTEQIFQTVAAQQPPPSGEKTGPEILTRLRALETSTTEALLEWKGILRADGHAHTRELSGLSAEVTERLREIQTALSAAAKAMERELAAHQIRTERLEKILCDGEKRADRREKRLYNRLAFAAVFCVALFAAILFLLLSRGV